MNIKAYLYSVLAVLAVLPIGSCTSEDVNNALADVHPVPLVVSATIGNTSLAATRAAGTHFNQKEWEDRWSYWKFEEGDQMGVFSQHGNPTSDNPDGPLDNIPLTYWKVGENEYVFTSDEFANINPRKLSNKTTFAYFPYDENTNDKGFELRRKDEQDGILKCVDFLRVEEGMDVEKLDTDGMLYAEFYHGFSELIIMRGDGFDQPKDDKKEIYVVLKGDGYTHLKITPKTTGNSWACDITLEGNLVGLENPVDDYHRWQAWVGDNYGKTEDDQEGKPASYVILPTVEKGSESVDMRTEVDYIELYDNDGNLQKVSALKLSNDAKSDKDPVKYSKRLTPGWCYPFEISMQELVPTVNPFPIVKWGENKNITDQRKCGIYSQTDFDDWLQAYKTYLESSDDQEHKDKLFRFGDEVLDSEGRFLYWQFYLRTDLDEWSAYSSSDVIIPKLQDVLDGQSYTLSNSAFQNHTIRGLKNHTFIGELSGQGVVQNLTFSRPEINQPTKNDAVGIVVKEMQAGTVTNCNVNSGTIISGGAVGIVAGTMEGGKIENCELSGMLIGASTSDNIVGENTGGTIENNRTNVLFTQQTQDGQGQP